MSFWKRMFSRKPKAGYELSLEECLESERSDTAVAAWLLHTVNETPFDKIAPQVINAYIVDRFLTEVNSEGLKGVFGWMYDDLPRIPIAMTAVKLPQALDLYNEALSLLRLAKFPVPADLLSHALLGLEQDSSRIARWEEIDRALIDMSGEIQQKNHAYLRENLEAIRDF